MDKITQSIESLNRAKNETYTMHNHGFLVCHGLSNG